MEVDVYDQSNLGCGTVAVLEKKLVCGVGLPRY